ncbi:Hypothetical protein PACV_455 [Pacmanvirus A23]|uniref:Hypothetical protein n=1 Tax=Pacmanvirus A23 TaxID=1932881 RepID=UPI000A09421C|nr:Hypothetical protein B9W72_gp451 [Pacmanvirus A23]SIP86168.1 Hypothetical protein PACV_455 [Pacmanvirus A23]
MNILDFSDEILVMLQGYLDKRSLYNFRISSFVGMRSCDKELFKRAKKKYKARIENFKNICFMIKNLSYMIDNNISTRYNWEDTIVTYASYDSLVEQTSGWEGCLEKEIMDARCDLVIQNTINKRNKDIKNGFWLNYEQYQKINNRDYLPNGRSFGILIDEIDYGKVFTIYTRIPSSRFKLPERYIKGVDMGENNEIFSLIETVKN